jgi:hypothetical protein
MDSHGSCFGQLAAPARVGSGEGVGLAAGGSSASVSGRRVCRTRLVVASVALRVTASRAGPGCGVVACLAQAVTVLGHHHLTVHSSRTGFASRLNSGVRAHL